MFCTRSEFVHHVYGLKTGALHILEKIEEILIN
jgi:hypothetical protein